MGSDCLLANRARVQVIRDKSRRTLQSFETVEDLDALDNDISKELGRSAYPGNAGTTANKVQTKTQASKLFKFAIVHRSARGMALMIVARKQTTCR